MILVYSPSSQVMPSAEAWAEYDGAQATIMLTSTYILLAAASTMTDVPYGTQGVILGWGRQAVDYEEPVTQLKGMIITTTSCDFDTMMDNTMVEYNPDEIPEDIWQEGMWPSSLLPEDKPRSMFICAFRSKGVGGTCLEDDGGDLPYTLNPES